MGVGGTMGVTGVAVYFPIKIGMGIKVAVGWFGSHVGICTMVGEDVMVGVTVTVGVSMGVKVTVAVAVGTGVFVDGNNKSSKDMPAQACTKTASTITR
jgi:hypothetical protein